MWRAFKSQKHLRLLLLFNVMSFASATLIYYQPGYEYMYHMNSTIQLKDVQQFVADAEIGFVSIAENETYQELLLIVHQAHFSPRNQPDIKGLTHDMSKWFSFEISRRGEIDNVYYLLDEDAEVIGLKKGYASMLSSKLHHRDEVDNDQDLNEWVYNTHEVGKEGPHKAIYRAKSTSTGYEFRKKRTLPITKEVNAKSVYEKTIHIRNDIKTIHKIRLHERFIMDFSVKPGYDPFYGLRKVRPDSDFEDIAFPTIEANSNDEMHLIERRPFVKISKRPKKLVVDSIHHDSRSIPETKLKKEDDIKMAISFITGNISCVRQQPVEGSSELLNCFHQLVSNMKQLPDEALNSITNTYLMCESGKYCIDDSLIYIDALGAVDTPKAQSLLLDKVLSNPSSKSSLYHRALMAVISMEMEPLPSLVTKLRELCLTGKYSNIIPLSAESQSRTCLTFGSVIGRLRKHGQEKKALELIEDLNSRLGIHDPWLYRQRRSIMTENEAIEHDLKQVVLIDSIGNAAMNSSFEYIVSHINSSNSQWIKRSGIHALSSFHDVETLNQLEKLAFYDEDETVRYEAALQYQAHPLANISNEQTETRELQKRSILEKTLRFKLEAPGVDWQKLLGSKKIGASFGVKMENLLDIQLSLLKGSVDVRVHDEVYSTIHFGYLGINLDYFKARICFKGGAKYGVNIIQETDLQLFFKHVKDFKTTVGKIVRTVRDGVHAFKSILNDDFSLKDIVDNFVASIEDIPTKVMTLGSQIRSTFEKLSAFKLVNLPPFIQPVTTFVDAVTNLYETIREDIMIFYNSIIEAVKIVIPQAAEQIFESVQGIMNGFMKIFKDPKTALADIGKGVILVYASIKQLNSTKHEIMTHTFITDGLGPYWGDLTDDISKIQELYEEALQSLKTDGKKWVSDTIEDYTIDVVTRGKRSLVEIKKMIVSELESEIQELLDPIFILKNLGGEYLQQFMNLFDVFKDIREAYTLFKNGYKTAKSIVNSIFGHKFDKDFPRTKRVSGGGCSGEGFYPSSLGDGHNEYANKGIDVLAAVGDELVAPVAGTVVSSDGNYEIVIKESDDLPEGSQLIITNIELMDTVVHNRQVTAGEVIGKVTKSPCTDNNHIHISVQRDGGFVDPSNYLADRVIEVPKWEQICDDYKLVYKFQTVASGYVVGLDGRKEENTTENIPEDTTLDISGMDSSNRPGQDIRDVKMDENGMYQKLSKDKRKRRSIDIQNITSALDLLVANIRDFVQRFSIRRVKLGNIVQFLDELGLEESKTKMTKLIVDIKEAIFNKQCRSPYHMTEQELSNELFTRGKEPKGSKEQMIKQLTTADISCPLLSMTLPNHELLYCTLDEKCLGIECCITIDVLNLLQKSLRVYVRLDPNPLKLTFGLNTWKYSIGTNLLVGEYQDTLDTGIEFDFLDGQRIVVKFTVKGSTEDVKLSFGIGVCDPGNVDDCYIYIPLLQNAVFPFPEINPDGTLHVEPINATKYLDEIKENIAESPADISEAIVENTIDNVLDYLGIDKSSLLNGAACPRPQNFDISELKTRMEKRGLSPLGSRQDLDNRYLLDDLRCGANGIAVTLPKLHNDFLYYFISDNCMRIDVCLEFNISTFGLSRSFNAFVQLDPCNYTLTLSFEKKEETIFLFSYNWGREEVVSLAADINIVLRVHKNDVKNVFLVDFGIKLDQVDQNVLEAFEIPIPVCNNNFSLDGSVKDLARALGGELNSAVFDLILKQLDIYDIIRYGECILPSEPTGCPESIDISNMMTDAVKDKLRCVISDNCFGISCCVGFPLTIPLSSTQINVTFPIWFKLDPCGFSVNYGIGDRSLEEQLLHYNWGTEEKVTMGRNAPVNLKYNIDHSEDGFVVDMAVDICLPIDNDTVCIPKDGITLLDRVEIPACNVNAWIQLANFSLEEWLKEKGEDLNTQLSNAGLEGLVDYLGLNGLIRDPPCDRKRAPYSPSVNGWSNTCPLSFFALPELPSAMSCNVPDYCTGIDCCLDVDKIGLAIRAYLDIDMCNYVVSGGIETETFTFSLFNYEWGKTKTITIKDFLQVRYSIKQPSNEKVFIVTLEIAACFEKDGRCLFKEKVLDGTEIPQIGCDISIDYSNFSISTWLKDNGLRSMTPTNERWKDAVKFVLEVTGLDEYFLDNQCSLEDKSRNLTSDFHEMDVVAASCKGSSRNSYMECCMRSVVLDRNLWMNFTFDPCYYILEVNVEKVNMKINLLEYVWGKRESVSLNGVFGIRFMVTNIQSEKQFSIDLDLQHYIQSDDEDASNYTVSVAKDLKVAYSACQNASEAALTEPYYGISYDFWRLSECSIETMNDLESTDVHGCGSVEDVITDVCRVSNNCSAVSCCKNLNFGDVKRNVYIQIGVDCKGTLQLIIENKTWKRALISFPEVISYKIADCIFVDLVIDENVQYYSLSLNVTVCKLSYGTITCDQDFMMVKQRLTKVQCTARKRRNAEEDFKDNPDYKVMVRELMKRGATADDIQKMFDDLIKDENLRKEETWQGEKLNDHDAGTGYSVDVKSLGRNNPQTLQHQRGIYTSTDISVTGGNIILDILEGVNDDLNRANQLFIVGNGLSNEGTKLLGIQLANMTIGDLEALLQINKVDPLKIFQLINDFIDLARALYSDLMERLVDRSVEYAFKSFDLTLRGNLPFPGTSVSFFRKSFSVSLGGIISLEFSFGVDGYYGVTIGWEGRLIARTAAGIVSPFGALTAYGEAGLGLGPLKAKLRLEGSFMNVRFPTRAEIGFSKFPLDVSMVMDLDLIPIRLRLMAVVTFEIDLLFVSFKKTLFRKNLWEYSSPKITKRMIDVSKDEKDMSPPEISQAIEQGGRERRGLPQCDVFQYRYRDYTEPEYSISVGASEDRGRLRFFLDIGTVPGGNDIVNNRQLGGPTTVQATSMNEYRSGEPLYFTLYPENTSGTRSSAVCMLSTYDTTPPTGRITDEFLTTSNPNVIKVSVIVHDDSVIEDAFVAIGYGKGIYGDQIHQWSSVDLDKRDYVVNDNDPMSHFTEHQEGKLISPPIKVLTDIYSASACAELCLKVDHCVSFNYDYGESTQCELLRAIRHFDESLAISALFCYFERLGGGHSTEVYNDTLHLIHNDLYFVNLDLTNVLGYRTILNNAGILADFTCPEPGYISNAAKDTMEFSDCLSLIPPDRSDLQRFCVGVHADRFNHRVIIDGHGSLTVFNGDKRLVDVKYTRSNNYIAGNWNGIHDNETGIRAYTLSIGHSICEDSIHPHHDPHKHLLDETQWTHMAIITATPGNKMFPLPSGKYYITVRAINKIEYGGPLSLTICHSTPYVIDITNPTIHEIFNIRYDEELHELSAEHNSTDQESGIAFFEICLGRNARSCGILPWKKFPNRSHFLYNYKIPDGVPAWLRLRVTNNVDLNTVGRANKPIIVDVSAPFPGIVYDGSLLIEDLQFTQYSNKICANWFDFYDPESGISEYEVGVGTEPMLTDVAELQKLMNNDRKYCFALPENTLKHNRVYYIVVFAYNGAIKQQNTSAVSNGVRIDLSKPVIGRVIDGNLKDFIDIQYSSSTTEVYVQWKNFHDPESSIRKHAVQTLRKRVNGNWEILANWTTVDNSTMSFTRRNNNLAHKDKIKSRLRVTNGALNEVEVETTGFLIDETPPVLEYLYDGEDALHDIEYQSETTALTVNFKFIDTESGIDHLKLQIHIQKHGSTRQYFPAKVGEWIDMPDSDSKTFVQTGLRLSPGGNYIARIRAVNGAGLVSTYESSGVIIDNSKPQVKWLNVGVLSGEEELIDGYVWQSDHNGIKAAWRTSDHQSGIAAVKYAVGTTNGGTDVLSWTSYEGTMSSTYIHCALEDTNEDTHQPVYYVTLHAKNGAGQWSEVLTSSPIKVVPEDVTGILRDGSFKNIDIDYQTDVNTVTVHFTGFESSLHSISSYDWAIGTSPGEEDVLPFVEYGIIHTEELSEKGVTSSGHAQTPMILDTGVAYYSTLRAKTTAGNILQVTSNGFMADTTPPIISFTRQIFNTSEAIYQYDHTSLAASWQYRDDDVLDGDNDENLDITWSAVGTYPLGADVSNYTYENATPNFESSLSVTPVKSGKPNIISVGVRNKAGLSAINISPPVVLDNTAPTPGEVTCSRFLQSRSDIECSWRGFADMESTIVKYYVYFGTRQGFDDIRSKAELKRHTKRIHVENILKDHGDTTYATVTAENGVGLTASAYSDSITVDVTPPVTGTVVDLPSTYHSDSSKVDRSSYINRLTCTTEQECLKIDAVCTEALTYIGMAWTGFDDQESSIKEYMLAIGTTKGGADIVPFFSVSSNLNHYIISNIDLKGQRQLFATVRAVNTALLTAEASSNGVYMSYVSQRLPPLQHIGVYDFASIATGDIQFQTDTSTIQAKWDTSGDPCPVAKYEWSIEMTDGTVVQDFVDMSTSTHGINDMIDLKEGRRYYSLVRVHNMIGYVYALRSDGVTVDFDHMLPGIVYDGDIIGHDLLFIPSRTLVTANWEGFGKERVSTALGRVQTGNKGFVPDLDIDPNQEVFYYEVALGTDRRFSKTLDNIVSFTNVGLNTSITFKDLDLVPRTAIYYFTVRAFSTSYASAVATSNGFYVGFNGGVTAGTIRMATFITTNESIEASWNDFFSYVDMLVYYVAISDYIGETTRDCKTYINGGNATAADKSDMFNTYPVTSVGIGTYLKTEAVSFKQNHSYVIWIIGVDKSGECNMSFHKFTVDTTPPFVGRITGGPYFDMKLAYTRLNTSLPVKWEGFYDTESDINIFNLTLWEKGSCLESVQKQSLNQINTVQLPGQYTNFVFIDLSLKKETVYEVSIEAINKAGLSSFAKTSPLLYDNSMPSPGRVIEGSDFTKDIVWWGHTDHINGSILHFPIRVNDTCPAKHLKMNDNGWSNLEVEYLNDPDGSVWDIHHREENIYVDQISDTCSIKIARDSKADRIYSAAYLHPSGLRNEGIYKLSVKAADGSGLAVTGITFWDGDDADLQIYKYQQKNWTEGAPCICCSETNSSKCDCSCDQFMSLNTTDNSTGSNDKSNSERSSYNSVKSRRSCGIQIYSGNKPFMVTWCQFVNESDNTLSVSTDLDFDPSSEYHVYMIEFFLIMDGQTPSHCVRTYIDDFQRSEMCGAPSLSSSTKLVLHVWNKDNSLPSLDIFALWEARAFFKNLTMPPDVNALCSYGEPFQGGTNPIVRYEAAIGTSKGAHDVVQFHEISRPCIPCANNCLKLDCDPGCVWDTYSAISFAIEDIYMNETYKGSYYLTVKAIQASGADISSSSNGFYIDITPPVFENDVFFYIDVRQGEYTPTHYQGSNDTIKAVWLCTDDKSEIKEYKWAIGTRVGGDDIQNFTSTGYYPFSQNSDLGGILMHNRTYYVSVKCTNEANLKTLYTDFKGVTTLFEEPDENSVDAVALDAENFTRPVFPATALESTNTTTCGLAWSKSSDEFLVRYDFCVGSSRQNIDDIVQCSFVGYNSSGKVEIKNGHLYIDDILYYNISELIVRSEKIYTSSNIDTDNAFQVENGRNIFLYMRLCNKAEICRIKYVNSVLFTSATSELLTSISGETVTHNLVSLEGRTKRDLAITKLILEIPSGTKPGQSILISELSGPDLTRKYTSAASHNYTPYIVNPSETSNLTERLLFTRIKAFHLPISVSPVGQEPLPGPLQITFTQQQNSESLQTGILTSLVHWNPDIQQWQLSDRTCIQVNETVTNSADDQTTTIKICDTRRTGMDTDRNMTENYFWKETQFALVSVSSTVENTAPKLIEPLKITMNEDTDETKFQLRAKDHEGDAFAFYISRETGYQFGNITVDNSGFMRIDLCKNCYGNAVAQVVVYDKPTPKEVMSMQSVYNITVQVLPVNDPPGISLYTADGHMLLHKDPTEKVVVYREQENDVNSSIVGLLVTYDVDGTGNLTILTNTDVNGSFSLHNAPADNLPEIIGCTDTFCSEENEYSSQHNVGWKAVFITFTQLNKTFVGFDEIKLVVMDEEGTYSDVVTLAVLVLEKKCQHGNCISKNPQSYSCDSIRRNENFDYYYTCACPASWNGTYCEDDVDECSLNLCESRKVCENTLGSYYCYCTSFDIVCKLSLEVWQFSVAIVAIIVMVVVVVAVIGAAVVCIRKKKNRRSRSAQNDARNDSGFVLDDSSRLRSFTGEILHDRRMWRQDRMVANACVDELHYPQEDIDPADEVSNDERLWRQNESMVSMPFTFHNEQFEEETESDTTVNVN